MVRAVFIVLCALILIRIFAGTLGALVSVFATPIAHIRTYIETSSAVLPVYIRDRNELTQTLRGLQEEISSHSGDEATIARLAAENTELRALLGVHNEERILAGIIGRPPTLPYDVLFLDQGEEDGIREGTVVYHADDQVIGFISAVYKKSSLVTLFSTPGVHVTAYLFGPNIYVHGYGEGSGTIRLSIPQGIEVSLGDVAVLPSVVPGSLGMVTSVLSVPTQPEQHAYVTMTTPIQSLLHVSVGTHAIDQITFEEASARVDALRSELFTIDVPDIQIGESATTSTTTTPTATTTE